MPDIYLLYCPCPTIDNATAMAKTLVTEHLVACANILPGMQSIYYWDDDLCHDTEVLLLAKVTATQRDAAMTRLTVLHPYDCPAIIAIPIAHASPAFIAWMHDND